MLKDWILPVVVVLAKFAGAVAVLSSVWVASGLFHRGTYKADVDTEIRIRIREECLRPAWVKTELQAEKYDLTERELDLVAGQAGLVSKRLDDLIAKSERLEALRQGLVQSKVPPRMGGIGGPAPSKR